MSEELAIWALKIQPGSAESGTNPYEFCKNQDPSIIGTGWGVEGDFGTKEEYLSACESRGWTDRWGNVDSSIRAMVNKASVDDFVWVNEKSEYALCRIESDWRYHSRRTNPKDEWSRHDIHNYRVSTWRMVDPSFVPGYVKRYFSAPKTPTMAQPKGGKTESARQFSDVLFNQNPKSLTEIVDLDGLGGKIQASETPILFDVLGPEETEDLVLDYLQSLGWHLIKSSTSKAQAGIECVLRRVKNGPETAYVQVKSGSASIDQSDYEELTNSGTVYLHQFASPPEVSKSGINWISPQELKEYIASNPGYIPAHTALKLDLALDN